MARLGDDGPLFARAGLAVEVVGGGGPQVCLRDVSKATRQQAPWQPWLCFQRLVIRYIALVWQHHAADRDALEAGLLEEPGHLEDVATRCAAPPPLYFP